MFAKLRASSMAVESVALDDASDEDKSSVVDWGEQPNNNALSAATTVSAKTNFFMLASQSSNLI